MYVQVYKYLQDLINKRFIINKINVLIKPFINLSICNKYNYFIHLLNTNLLFSLLWLRAQRKQLCNCY